MKRDNKMGEGNEWLQSLSLSLSPSLTMDEGSLHEEREQDGKGNNGSDFDSIPPSLSLPFSHSFSVVLSRSKSRTPSLHLGDEEICIPPIESSPHFSLFLSTAPQRWTRLCIYWLWEAPALGSRLSVPVVFGLLRTRPSLLAPDNQPDNPAQPWLYTPSSLPTPASRLSSLRRQSTTALSRPSPTPSMDSSRYHARLVLGFPSVVPDPKIELDAPGFVPSLGGLFGPPLSSFRSDPTPPMASGSGLH